jgi:hypothetical protein
MIDICTKIQKEKTEKTGLKGITVQGLKSADFGHMIMRDRTGYKYLEVGLLITADSIRIKEEKERPVYKNFDVWNVGQLEEFETKTVEEERTVGQYVIPLGSEVTIKSSMNGKETWKLDSSITQLTNQLDVLIPLENEC